jgi:hypothetical protein
LGFDSRLAAQLVNDAGLGCTGNLLSSSRKTVGRWPVDASPSANAVGYDHAMDWVGGVDFLYDTQHPPLLSTSRSVGVKIGRRSYSDRSFLLDREALP